MFESRELKALSARKAQLLQASEANRQSLNAAATQFRPLVGWIDTGMEWARRARALGPVLALLLRSAKSDGSCREGGSGWLTRIVNLTETASAVWRVFRAL